MRRVRVRGLGWRGLGLGLFELERGRDAVGEGRRMTGKGRSCLRVRVRYLVPRASWFSHAHAELLLGRCFVCNGIVIMSAERASERASRCVVVRDMIVMMYKA